MKVKVEGRQRHEAEGRRQRQKVKLEGEVKEESREVKCRR